MCREIVRMVWIFLVILVVAIVGAKRVLFLEGILLFLQNVVGLLPLELPLCFASSSVVGSVEGSCACFLVVVMGCRYEGVMGFHLSPRFAVTPGCSFEQYI